MEEFKPGQVISPQGATTAVDQPVSPMPQPATPQPERPTEQVPVAPPPTQGNEPVNHAAAEEPPVPANEWSFRQEDSVNAPSPRAESHIPQEISWTAAEFVAHEKSLSWYVILALGGVAGASLIYFLTKDKLTTGIIALAALAFGVFAARQPKEQSYAVDAQGLHIGNHMYAMQNFKSFSVTEDAQSASIVLMPLKRFMPALTIYLTQEVVDDVVDLLSEFLPFEQHRQDAVESLMKRIRF